MTHPFPEAPDDAGPPSTQGADPATPPATGEDGDAPEPETAGVAAASLEQSLEALLFLADEPLDVATLVTVTESDPDTLEATLIALSQRFVDERRGIEIRSVAGGWRMYSAPAARPVVERWALAGRTGRLTQAALETLAVITYKQPIGRQEIGEIRGVNADGAVRSLVARGLVTEVGRDPGPGQAALFGTTRLLLERLGLDSLDDLPPLTEFLPEAPAPDEPELGALKEIRRRLASGGTLPTGGLGGRSNAETNTGDPSRDQAADDEDHDVLPPPTAKVGGRDGDEQMDELTDRLEVAARNAVDRLRVAVAAGDGRPPDSDGSDGSEGSDDESADHDDPADPDDHGTPTARSGPGPSSAGVSGDEDEEASRG